MVDRYFFLSLIFLRLWIKIKEIVIDLKVMTGWESQRKRDKKRVRKIWRSIICKLTKNIKWNEVTLAFKLII